MLKKQFYEAPEAEELLVKFERNFMETEPEGLKANPVEQAIEDEHWGRF